MLRKCICLIGMACVVMVLTLPVKGAARKGSIQVVPVWAGEPVDGGGISVCRVGRKTETGFLFTDGLANWTVSQQEVLSGNWINWLQERGVGPGVCRPAEQGKGAVFSELEEGIYLVQQTEALEGFAVFHPFLLTIPDGENWSIYRELKLIQSGESPNTGDHPAPIIGAMGLGLSVAIIMVFADERKK